MADEYAVEDAPAVVDEVVEQPTADAPTKAVKKTATKARVRAKRAPKDGGNTMSSTKKAKKASGSSVPYWKTEKGRAAAARYAASAKGKAARKRYAASHAKSGKKSKK